MLDHVSIGAHDFARSADFYTEVLGALGYRLQRRTDDEAAFGPDEKWSFFVYRAAPDQSVVGARAHIALYAEDRATALAAHAAATARGAQSAREVAHRPEFGPDYFGGMFRDLDGHLIEIVTRAA